MFICDHHDKCGFASDSLNNYLAHKCCRECGYIAVYANAYLDAAADLKRHWKSDHPAIVAANRASIVSAINELNRSGSADQAGQLLDIYRDFYAITDADLKQEG